MKKMIQFGLVSALALFVATPAMANDRGTVHIYNCNSKEKTVSGYKYKATVCVYDGADESKSTARHRKTLIPGTKWSPWCKGKNALGQNSKRCKVYLVSEAGNACPIDGASGKNLKRVGWNANVYISGGKIAIGDKAHCSVKP